MTDNTLHKKILQNDKYVQHVQSLYDDTANVVAKINFINYLITYKTLNVTSAFSDSFLEKELNSVSQTLKLDLNNTFEKNSVLHIMTEAYSTGGHTKLVEQFISNASTYFDKQSVIITNQQVEIPQTLETIVESTGDLILMNENNMLERAIKLANIASSYHYIVLHIHPDEIVCNLAFGNTNFTRPVILLNHADHMFWCGASIADLVLDLNTEGSEFSFKIRGIAKSAVLNIPIEDKKKELTKQEAREYLKIHKDEKIILSIASEYKYGKTKEEISKFIDMATTIVTNVPNSKFLLIGPSTKNVYWDKAYKGTKGKIEPLGLQDRKLLPYYIIASDLYIESFPFASYTAFLETALYDINMLSLNTPIFTLDAIKQNQLLANTVEELQSKAISLLNTSTTRKKSLNLDVYLKDTWTKNLIDIFTKNKQLKHQVDSFKEKNAESIYLNHIGVTIEGDYRIPNYLPAKLKFTLLFSMKRYKVITTTQFLRLLRKIIKGIIRGK